MKKFEITANGKHKATALLPDGRKEVTLEQWNKAYPFLMDGIAAQGMFDEGDIEEAQIKIVQSMCNTMSALSTNLDYDDLINIDFDKLNNLFLLQFSWLTNESPKKNFKINGRNFSIPDFEAGSAGDFMDIMSLIQSLKDEEEADKGLAIAAIYMRQGEYYQDLNEIRDRMDFLKEYARMDLFFSCAFFLRSSLERHKTNIIAPLTLRLEVEKLASVLIGWATTLYLQTLQNPGSSRIPR